MNSENGYQHLEHRLGSLYHQPFIKGTRIRVEIPYGFTIPKTDEEGVEPGCTPAEVATSFNLPLEAVEEAIAYCQAHWDVILADHAREDLLMEVSGMNHPEYKNDPKKHYRPLSLQEYGRIIHDEPLPGR